MPFTDKQVSALKPRSTRYEKMEPGRTGLILRISPRGEKTWAFRYRLGGKHKRMVFGTYPMMTLHQAHKALVGAKEKLKQGFDPGEIAAQERETERNAETMADLSEEYLTRHARRTMKATSANEDERLLTREIVPRWGDRRAKDITRRDVIKLLDTIEDRGARVMRNRTAGLLSRVFRFGIDRGIVDASPAVGIRRLEEQSRDRFLTVDEIRSFWHGLDEVGVTPAVRNALRFLLVTGQRRAEVARADRAEIDDDEGLWHLPGERTKNGRPHLLPLPRLAMQLVADADRSRTRPRPACPIQQDRRPYDPTPSPFLFPSTRHGKPLEPAAVTRALTRNREQLGIGDATVHDLRRTFATWQSELGAAPEVLSALLNHAPTTITGQVYDRATNLEPRRQAMEVWCRWLDRVISGEKVTENVVQMVAS